MASLRKSDNTNVDKILKIIFAIIFGLPFLIAIISPIKNTNSTVENVADGFLIDAYKVTMNVGEDNKVEVTEEITVDWYESGHHGIYKFTPEWLEYTSKDGQTIKRKSNLTDYFAVGEPYVVDEVKSKPRIKIGDSLKTLPLGKKNYTIKYTYDMGKDPYKKFDEFIFHAFGDYWGTLIQDASLEIHMPKNFDIKNISFWGDKYRNNNLNSNVDYYISGNTLYAKVSNNYDLTKSLTVDISLPDGYFVGGSNNYGYSSLGFCLLIILFAILTFLKWLKYGRDYKKISRTVEFYPPEDLDAAQIGYIYGKQSSKKLTIALIVSLASKGYIKIDEDKENGDILITNLFPKHNTNKLDNIKRTIIVTKIKDSDDELTEAQKAWMGYLFKEGNRKEVISGFTAFFQKTEDLLDKYIKIESDITEGPSDSNDSETKILPNLTANEKIVFDSLFSSSDVNKINEDPTFYKVFEKIYDSLNKELRDTVIEKKSTNQRIVTIVFLVLGIIAYIYAWVDIEDLNPQYSYLYTIALVSLFIMAFLAIIMGRKTHYGELITARVLGFRNYIEKAEKNQIEKLVEENPNYFFYILPYAYAMNVSKKWIQKLEKIPNVPTSMGNFDYYDIVSFNYLSNSITYPTSTGNSSGGGSSCGGGCSSCGGGCSSCGGGGSW